MKKFLLTAVLGMFAVAGFSQLKWDAKVGMSMSNITKMDYDMKVGYSFGVGLDYAFTDMWSLQSGLMFTSKGAKNSEEENGEKETYKVNTHYLEIPILAAAKFDLNDNMKFVVNAGPYLAFGLGGITTSTYEADGEEEKEHGEKVFKEYEVNGEKEDAMMKRFDMGLQYGVGLEINEHFLVNVTGQYGFINPLNGYTYKDSDGYISTSSKELEQLPDGVEKISPKNLSFIISVGYRF